MSYIELLHKAIEEIAPKEPSFILINDRTFGSLLYELRKLNPYEIHASGKLYFQGTEVIVKNEIENDKFIIL
jgi:hypothetical protein